MTAINAALAIDFTGQIVCDTLGYQAVAGVGGQLAFAVGASLAKGGRYILAVPSITSNGASRIVSSFQQGTTVGIPRNLADVVVSEYGIAYLRGKSQRQRVDELVSIAHPDFRAELRKEARKAFWP
jgi:4-hydroxybutyrate CoA-transferase